MRKSWLGMPMLAAGLLLLASCSSGPDKYKPTPPPEAYAQPPLDDSRFSQPIAYPKNVLNKDNPKKDDDSGTGTPSPMRSPSMGGGG